MAGSVTGNVNVTAVGALAIDAVNGVNGFSTGGGDAVFLVPGGLTLADNLNAGGGMLLLTTPGALQTGGVITANQLLLAGNGAFTLNQANDVQVLAANINGALNYTDANAVVIGTVGPQNGIDTHNNNITLNAGG